MLIVIRIHVFVSRKVM